MSLSALEFISAHTSASQLNVDESTPKMTSILVMDAIPPLGLMENDGILHSEAIANASKSLLDAMAETQSVLHQRDDLEVVVVCADKDKQGFSKVRIVHLVEAKELRDGRKRSTAMRHLRTVWQTGMRLQDAADVEAYCGKLISALISCFIALAAAKKAAIVRATVMSSSTVADRLRLYADSKPSGLGGAGFSLHLRLFALVPSRVSASFAPHRSRFGERSELYEVENFTANVAWALRSVLGDILESRGELKILDGAGNLGAHLSVSVRPRVLPQLGTASLYNPRIALPARVSIRIVQRVSTEAVGEDVLLGVAHVVSVGADGRARMELTRLVQGLRERGELLIVQTDAEGAFRARFGVLFPSRGERGEVLLLRDLACAETILPLGFWRGNGVLEAEGDKAKGTEGERGEVDLAAHWVQQSPFEPPKRGVGN